MNTQYIVCCFHASKIIITIYCTRVKGISQDIAHKHVFRQDAQKSVQTFVDFSFHKGLDKAKTLPYARQRSHIRPHTDATYHHHGCREAHDAPTNHVGATIVSRVTL